MCAYMYALSESSPLIYANHGTAPRPIVRNNSKPISIANCCMEWIVDASSTKHYYMRASDNLKPHTELLYYYGAHADLLFNGISTAAASC